MVLPSEARGRVLVTGLSGFTGRHLRTALEAAGYVVCDSEPNGEPTFDLNEPSSIDKLLERMYPDYVCHLAGLGFVPHGDISGFYDINTVGTTNLLEAISQSGLSLRRIVIASSANVYGNATVESIDESTTPAPVNHYACSKLAMEHMARTWFDRLPIIITRPFNYTGIGQATHFVIPKIVDHFARRSAQIELGNLDVIRDFSDVRAVASVYSRLMDAGTVGETYNICSGHGHSLKSIIDSVADISRHSVNVEVNPLLIRESDVKRLIGSNAKLVSAIGPLGFANLGATLRWMYNARLEELGAAGIRSH